MSTYTDNISNNITDNISDNISNNKHNDDLNDNLNDDLNEIQNDDKIDEFVRICRYFDIDEHEKLALSKITIFEQIFSNNYIYNIKNIDSTIQAIHYYRKIDFNERIPFIIHERFKLIKNAFSGSCTYIKKYLTPYGLSLLEDEQSPLCHRYRKEVSKHISQHIYRYVIHNLHSLKDENKDESEYDSEYESEYESEYDTEPDPDFDEYVGVINLETNPYAIANGGRPFIPDNVNIEQLNAFYAMAQM